MSGNSTISGRIFEDLDGDNIDQDEPGVRWILVQLRTPDGQIIAETRSAADGSYSFEGLDAGDYVIRFGRDAWGRDYVTPNIGDDSSDSDATPYRNGVSFVRDISLGENEEIADLDAGLGRLPPEGLEGIAFVDTNGNGVYDRLEDGLASGVTVTLYDEDGAQVAQTVTDANGAYRFETEPDAAYSVGFDTSYEDYSLIAPDQGPDATDSDPNAETGMTYVIFPEEDGTLLRQDAGYGAATDTTGSISGRVFEDTNGNGVDDNEPGVAGIALVVNVDGQHDGTTVVYSGADGSYEFSDLPLGTYSVDMISESETLSDGRQIIDANVGNDDTVDSDFRTHFHSPGLGQTPDIGVDDIYVSSGAPDVTDVDLGLTPVPTGDHLASVSGRMFEDLNGNGIDDNEPGIANADVYLYVGWAHWSNDPIFAYTDADGNYSFTGLDPAAAGDDGFELRLDYYEEGYRPSPRDVGDDDTIDSDGPTVNFDLAPGEDLTDVDQGFIPPPADSFAFEV